MNTPNDITLRDWLAGLAMQSILDAVYRDEPLRHRDPLCPLGPDDYAKAAYENADAMLRAADPAKSEPVSQIPPWPPVPEGFDRWEDRGKAWKPWRKVEHYVCSFEGHSWSHYERNVPAGDGASHYLEAVREAKETPTTVEGWLQTLPDGYRERALANTSGCERNKSAISTHYALGRAFLWRSSPQGFWFWDEVYKAIEEGTPLPPLP